MVLGVINGGYFGFLAFTFLRLLTLGTRFGELKGRDTAQMQHDTRR